MGKLSDDHYILILTFLGFVAGAVGYKALDTDNWPLFTISVMALLTCGLGIRQIAR